MAFTDNSDLYAAITDDGVERIIQHVMLQRPSYFNHATADVIADDSRWCARVEHTQDVTDYFNPIFMEWDPLPVIGVDSPPVTIGFCAQVVKALLDFHPSNIIELPAELAPPLNEQRFGLMVVICATIQCPDEDQIVRIPVKEKDKSGEQEPIPPVHVPGKPNCFCLDVYATGHFQREVILGQERILAQVENVEIVDVEPERMEANMECYLKLALNLILRQRLSIPLETFFFEIDLFDLATVTLSPTTSPPVPNNPAVEDDQLKVFMTMTTAGP
jgi:hypothetical protein